MITNKLLTLGLALTLMSPLASFARMGAESGGGGDAVMVNGQLVMRDMVNTDQTEKVKDNFEFIKSVPKFREMIYKIAKANPVFASNVVGELSRVNLYTSPTSLPILPYDVTTLSGRGAEVQLAIRAIDDIVFAPEFFTFNQKEDVLLHEILHGLLSDNSGPFHHQRVRNIVRYIHENLNNLNAEALDEVLSENNWHSSARYEKIEAQLYAWDKTNNSDLRCYYAYKYEGGNRYGGIPDAFAQFEKLNCVGKGQIEFGRGMVLRNADIEKYMKDNYSAMMTLRGDEYIYMSESYPYVSLFELEKDGLFTKKHETALKQSRCKNNTESINEVKNYIQKFKNYLAASKMMNKAIENDGLKELEKDVIRQAMELSTLGSEDNTFEIKLEDTIKGKEDVLKTLFKQKAACDKQYPNL